MQVVLLRVVVRAGVRRVRLVAIGVAGLALDVEQRRVGEEGRGGQAERVLRVRGVAGLRVRVRVLRVLRVRVPVRGRVRGGVRLASLARAVPAQRLRQRQRHLRQALLTVCNSIRFFSS